MKFLRSLVEATFKPSGRRYFEVRDTFPIYHGGNFFGKSKENQAQPGDEIHAIPGGNFLIRDGKVIVDSFVPLTDPDENEGTHHEYRNSPSQFVQTRFNALVKRGTIAEIAQNEATPIKYR